MGGTAYELAYQWHLKAAKLQEPTESGSWYSEGCSALNSTVSRQRLGGWCIFHSIAPINPVTYVDLDVFYTGNTSRDSFNFIHQLLLLYQ
jgi:hypothetical protein